VNATHLFGDFYSVSAASLPLLWSEPSVYSVSPFPDLAFDSRWSAGFLQSGDDGFAFISGLLQSKRLQNARGLTGANVTITLIDSGVDVDHCFFRDTSHPVPYSTLHRKIVRYDPAVDSSDFRMGHGTVCGSIICDHAECDRCAMNL
jgi:subtilisin family serine protease